MTAGFVAYDPAEGRYALRADFAPFLTGPGPDNLARTMRYLTLMGQVSPLVAEKFRTGGGLSYTDYPDFHHLMAQDSAAVNDASLIDTILPLTGLVGRLQAGIDVADVGCGEGHAINLMAQAFPASRFTGIDFSDEALTVGRAEAAAWGLSNANFESQDAASIDSVAAYDLILAFDAIHDQAHPATVLANIHRALRPGGTFLMIDINASSRLEDNVELPGRASSTPSPPRTACRSRSVRAGTGWAQPGVCRPPSDAGRGRVQPTYAATSSSRTRSTSTSSPAPSASKGTTPLNPRGADASSPLSRTAMAAARSVIGVVGVA